MERESKNVKSCDRKKKGMNALEKRGKKVRGRKKKKRGGEYGLG